MKARVWTIDLLHNFLKIQVHCLVLQVMSQFIRENKAGVFPTCTVSKMILKLSLLDIP